MGGEGAGDAGVGGGWEVVVEREGGRWTFWEGA